jgi:hypothetical protein
VVSPEKLPSSGLTLLDSEGKKVNRDVYSVEGFLWNSGTETILGSDVIMPLVVTIPSSVRLLDAQPLYTSRPELTQARFRVDKTADIAALRFDFRVLEPGEGLTISILFEGPKDAEFVVSGGVTGIRQLGDQKTVAREERWSALKAQYLLILIVALFFALVAGAMVVSAVVWSKVSKAFPRFSQIAAMVTAFGFVSLVGIAVLAAIYAMFIQPLIQPEKIAEARIRDFVPKELKRY